MRPFIFAALFVISVGDLAKPYQSERETYLKDVRGEQLLGLIECYRDVSKTACHQPAVSLLADDIIYLVQDLENRIGSENWKDVDTKLKILMVDLVWKRHDSRLADQESKESINTDQASTLEEREEWLEAFEQQCDANQKEVQLAIERAAKNGWKIEGQKK